MGLCRCQMSSFSTPPRTWAMCACMPMMGSSTSRKRGYVGHCTVAGVTLFRVAERPGGPPEDRLGVPFMEHCPARPKQIGLVSCF